MTLPLKSQRKWLLPSNLLSVESVSHGFLSGACGLIGFGSRGVRAGPSIMCSIVAGLV